MRFTAFLSQFAQLAQSLTIQNHRRTRRQECAR